MASLSTCPQSLSQRQGNRSPKFLRKARIWAIYGKLADYKVKNHKQGPLTRHVSKAPGPEAGVHGGGVWPPAPWMWRFGHREEEAPAPTTPPMHLENTEPSGGARHNGGDVVGSTCRKWAHWKTWIRQEAVGAGTRGLAAHGQSDSGWGEVFGTRSLPSPWLQGIVGVLSARELQALKRLKW